VTGSPEGICSTECQASTSCREAGSGRYNSPKFPSIVAATGTGLPPLPMKRPSGGPDRRFKEDLPTFQGGTRTASNVPALFLEPMPLVARFHRPDALAPHRPTAGGRAWQYELKFDGFRAVAFKSAGKVRQRSRNDKDFNGKYPASLHAETPSEAEVLPEFNHGLTTSIPCPGYPELALRRYSWVYGVIRSSRSIR
jgi:hypothetical protein